MLGKTGPAGLQLQPKTENEDAECYSADLYNLFFPRFFLFDDDLCLLFRFSFNLDVSFSVLFDYYLATDLASLGLPSSFDYLTALSYFAGC